MKLQTSRTHGALALLEAAPADGARSIEWRRLARDMLAVTLVAAAAVAGWSAAAPLAGAVVAAAQVRVEYRRKTVQHQEGGIVREILVRDGQLVRVGEPLVVVGDARREADLDLLRKQWLAARARFSRAEAESRLAPVLDTLAELMSDGADEDILAREQAAFHAHRRALDEQSGLLRVQLQQAEAQAAALGTQIESIGLSAALSDEELGLNTKLAEQGFVSRARLITLQRAANDYRSQIGVARGDQAAAAQRVAELRARIAQLRVAYQTQATDESKEASAQAREAQDRMRAARDEVERQVVRAPVDGQVMSLHVAAVGEVVAPRQALLDVVPAHERLVVDARIDPQDIEHVRTGGSAQIRLVSNDARYVPLLPGRVTFVSGDRVTQPDTGRSWFDATIEVDAQAASRAGPSQQLQAGMPAEVYVTTGERTLLEYLTRPLRAFTEHALREPG